ncbi:MAG: Rieske 2Fe-2S domain-containing protein [Thermoleophilia bacterium]
MTARLVAVARLEDIPRLEGRPVTIGGRRVAIFRTPGGPRALVDACPHRGGPLSDGLVGDDCVVCPLHGRRVSLSTGEVDGRPDERVETVPVTERDGWLYVEVGW